MDHQEKSDACEIATASLLCGLIGLVLVFNTGSVLFGLLCAIAGLVCAIQAKKQGCNDGNCKAGLTLSIISLSVIGFQAILISTFFAVFKSFLLDILAETVRLFF